MAVSEGSFIEGDLACAECGYNLRTLRIEGTCPECGADVRRSLVPLPVKVRSYLSALLALGGVVLVVHVVLFTPRDYLLVLGRLIVASAVELVALILSIITYWRRVRRTPQTGMFVVITLCFSSLAFAAFGISSIVLFCYLVISF